MNKETKGQLKKRLANSNIITVILLIFCIILHFTNGFDGLIIGRPFYNMVGFSTGLTVTMLIANILFLTGKLEAICNRRK